jgi:hypothetical protein
MKILVIFVSNKMDSKDIDNIKILKEFLIDYEVDYCAISSTNDFDIYEQVIDLKYKIVNTKKQLSKITDFITDTKDDLNYDWFIKIRPDNKLLEKIDFSTLKQDSINARARVYAGPRMLKYGMTVNGKGYFAHIRDCSIQSSESKVILDDTLFIFGQGAIRKGAFDKILEGKREDEWFQTAIFNNRKIPLNVIGIFVLNTKHNIESGHLNM